MSKVAIKTKQVEHSNRSPKLTEEQEAKGLALDLGPVVHTSNVGGYLSVEFRYSIHPWKWSPELSRWIEIT